MRVDVVGTRCPRVPFEVWRLPGESDAALRARIARRVSEWERALDAR